MHQKDYGFCPIAPVPSRGSAPTLTLSMPITLTFSTPIDIQVVHRGGRSTKAGAPTPATPGGRRRSGPARPALNEGRGSHPGDTANPKSTAEMDS